MPFFEGRVGPGWDQLGKRTSDEDLTLVLKRLKKRPLDYFKDFYADTAVFGSKAATLCGLEFYGSDRVLFASDSPFDPEKGPGYIRDTLRISQFAGSQQGGYGENLLPQRPGAIWSQGLAQLSRGRDSQI